MNSIILNEQKILEIEKQLLEAMKKSDIEILDQLLHEDLLFVLPSGEVITKKMDLETHKSGNLVLDEITSSIDSIKLNWRKCCGYFVYKDCGKNAGAKL